MSLILIAPSIVCLDLDSVRIPPTIVFMWEPGCALGWELSQRTSSTCSTQHKLYI